jgi:tetratricopeptide (TPR) repeat protein
MVLNSACLLILLGSLLGGPWVGAQTLDREGVDIAQTIVEAYQRLESGDAASAEAQFSALLAVEPENLAAHEGRVWALLALQDFNRASTEADRFLAVDPDDPRRQLRWLRFIALIPARRTDAIAALRAAVETDPDNLELRLDLVELLTQREETLGEAREQARTAVELHPEDRDEQLELAWALALVGDQEEAIARLDALIETDRNDADALVLRAEIAEWNMDFPTAERLLGSASALRPDDEALRARFEVAAQRARTVREGPRHVSLLLLVGFVTCCVAVGSVARGMTLRIYLTVVLVASLLVGVALLWLQMGS